MPDHDNKTEVLRSKVLQTTLSEIASRPAPDGTSTEADQCCVICLDVVSDPCEARPCGHRNFDFLCLVSWLNQSPDCPLCKASLTQVHYQFSNEATPGAHNTYNVPQPASSQPNPAQGQPSLDRQRDPRWSNGPSRRRQSQQQQQIPGDDAALSRRRHVYEHQLYSLHVGTNRIARYTDLTPAMFESDPTLVSRARMWIRRELRVFDFLCAPADGDGGSRTTRQLSSNAEFLLEYIVAILKSTDLRGSRGQAEEMLHDFLGRENTRLFLHELRAWLRSPYTALEAWDAHVQYDQSKSVALPRTGSSSTGQTATEAAGHVPRSENEQYALYEPRRGGSWRPESDRYSPYGRHKHRREAVREDASERSAGQRRRGLADPKP